MAVWVHVGVGGCVHACLCACHPQALKSSWLPSSCRSCAGMCGALVTLVAPEGIGTHAIDLALLHPCSVALQRRGHSVRHVEDLP